MRFLSVVFLFITGSLFAQHTITGLVVDAETGEPLLGAHVYLLNNWRVGATTDLEGKFAFELTDESMSDTLIVSYIGFQEKQVPLNKASKIKLKPVTVVGETVTVTAKPLIAEEFKYQKINKIEIYTNPAAKADPLLAVTSLPSSTTTDESAISV